MAKVVMKLECEAHNERLTVDITCGDESLGFSPDEFDQTLLYVAKRLKQAGYEIKLTNLVSDEVGQ